MFEKLKHHWAVRKLTAQRIKNLAFFDPKLKAAYAKDDMDALGRLLEERNHETGLIDDELDFLLSEFYRERAETLRLVTPPFSTTDGTYVEGAFSRKWRLNAEQINNLRSAVRKEEKERYDEWRTWLTLMIGFGGMLIGLISMLKK